MNQFIFFIVGWMAHYRGLQDDEIRGGGSFVDQYHYGHEVLNFLPYRGRMYGYAQTPRRLSLERLGAPVEAPSISGITVVWVARSPEDSVPYVVGWYDNATVSRCVQEPVWVPARKMEAYVGPDIPAVQEDIGRYMGYVATAAAADCHLVPLRDRHFAVPDKAGGVGTARVWYGQSPRGARCKQDLTNYIQTWRLPYDASLLKYGRGGEGEEHRQLKEWCAGNPAALGLDPSLVAETLPEFPFVSRDRADIVFRLADNHFAVVEVETIAPEPGVYQALKYRTLLCAENRLPVDSGRVTTILVAWDFPRSVRQLCEQYGVQCITKRL